MQMSAGSLVAPKHIRNSPIKLMKSKGKAPAVNAMRRWCVLNIGLFA
jgi:hypothetical protein